MGLQAINILTSLFSTLPFSSLLFGMNFVLNECERVNNFRMYPHLSELSDRNSTRAVTTPVAFPDIDTQERPENFFLKPMKDTFSEVIEKAFGSICRVLAISNIRKTENL